MGPGYLHTGNIRTDHVEKLPEWLQDARLRQLDSGPSYIAAASGTPWLCRAISCPWFGMFTYMAFLILGQRSGVKD